MSWDGGKDFWAIPGQFSGLSRIPSLSVVLVFLVFFLSQHICTLFISSLCNASSTTHAEIFPSCFCLTWPGAVLGSELVVTCNVVSICSLFVGKTDFFLSCSWLSFQSHFYFWPKQTGQCPAAELIVLLVGVPAVHHLLIPPDKLLPKFKDWLLFVLLLRVLAITPYLLWINKDRIYFCWLILGSLDQRLWVSGAVHLAGLCLDLFSMRHCLVDQLRENRPAFSILLDILPSLFSVFPTVLSVLSFSDMKVISLQFCCFMNPVWSSLRWFPTLS